MRQVTIDIPDSKYSFFLELITNLGFSASAKKSESKENENPVYKSLQEGFKELEMVKAGTLKARPLKDFLDEI